MKAIEHVPGPHHRFVEIIPCDFHLLFRHSAEVIGASLILDRVTMRCGDLRDAPFVQEAEGDVTVVEMNSWDIAMDGLTSINI